MRVKIITIHNIPNYGSVFQALALNQYISNCGHDCEVIDYNPSYFVKGNIKARIGRLLNYRAYRSRTKKYRSFVEQNMKLTAGSYSNANELRAVADTADIFIAGGDQLWNEFYDCGQDDAYKLLFTEKRKAAFGTSLGKDSFSPEGMSRLIAAIKVFEHIGIREQSGAELLRKAGIEHVHHVCDPVFLLERGDYQKFIKPTQMSHPYMFVYLVQPSALLDRAVDYISQQLGLKVVLYAGFTPKCHSDLFLKEIGPEETLSYVANADFILSASFHASAFSVLFHKQFITLLPGESTNARIEDFLGYVGLQGRIVSDQRTLEAAIANPIEWAKTDNIMRDYILDSKNYLAQILCKQG